MGKYLSVLSFVPPLFISWYRDCACESSLLDSSAIIGFQVDVLLQPFNLRVSEAGLYIIIVCVCVHNSLLSVYLYYVYECLYTRIVLYFVGLSLASRLVKLLCMWMPTC